MESASDTYLRTDHWHDAVESLEAAQEFSARVSIGTAYWKWLLISIHSAVQGFMALALEQGNSLLVLRDDIAAKWLKAHEAGTPYPQDKMDFFLALYGKIKTDEVCRYYGSKKFVPGSSHDYSMEKLNELRNGFIHFLPRSWSIELAGLPSICVDALDITEFLGWESTTILWHDAKLSERGRRAATITRATLQALRATYVDES